MTNEKFHDLFGGAPRKPGEPLTQRHMDLAASIQTATEEVVLTLTRALAAETGAHNLCLAGGVALNCVANGRVWRDGRFRGLWIQPAAGDAGGALGAALCTYHLFKDQPRQSCRPQDRMQGAYLGPSFSQQEIEARLAKLGAKFCVLNGAQLLEATVDALVDGVINRLEQPPQANQGWTATRVWRILRSRGQLRHFAPTDNLPTL